MTIIFVLSLTYTRSHSSVHSGRGEGIGLSLGWLFKDLVVPNLCLPTEVILYAVVSFLFSSVDMYSTMLKNVHIYSPN